jgi:hypothetical protein
MSGQYSKSAKLPSNPVLAKLMDYLSRKFVLALLSLGGGLYVTITQPEGKVYAFATLVGVIVAFYNGSNVAEVFANRGKSGKQGVTNGSNSDSV